MFLALNSSNVRIGLLCVGISVIVQLVLPPAVDEVKRLCASGYLPYPCTKLKTDGSLQAHSYARNLIVRHLPPITKTSIDTSNREVIIKPFPDVIHDPAREKEALAALLAAVNYRSRGNLKKAKIIIEHALALTPGHPDVLTEYGIVHEQENNFIEADMCYAKALAYDPSHGKALERRRRTLPLVSAEDQKMLNNLRKRLDEFNHLSYSTSLRRAMRESYFLHVYHTVAIEGNTLSLGQTRSILETGMPVEGKSILEHNEVIGMDSALRFLNNSLLMKSEISLEDILEMHLRVLGHVDPVVAGRIRTTQVYVGHFTPVAPEYVREQMEDLVDWLNSQEATEIDPVELAAIAHYKLVVVHPFVDGNGRTARLLMNLILMRAGFPPVILPVESRAMYYATLSTANLGDLRPFVRYIAKHTENALKHFIEASSPVCDAECVGRTSTLSDNGH